VKKKDYLKLEKFEMVFGYRKIVSFHWCFSYKSFKIWELLKSNKKSNVYLCFSPNFFNESS